MLYAFRHCVEAQRAVFLLIFLTIHPSWYKREESGYLWLFVVQWGCVHPQMRLVEQISGNNIVAEHRFRSRSEHTLDSKGRLNIPTRFREVLREVYTETLIVTNWDHCLRAYPVSEWEAMEEVLEEQGRRQPGFTNFVRYVISGMTECNIDKQGRILLPPTLRSEFNIEKDVVLNGMLRHFEIWNKDDWAEKARKTRENFSDFGPALSELGIL